MKLSSWWPPTRRRREREERDRQYWEEHQRFINMMAMMSYANWLYQPPPKGVVIQITRKEWPHTQVIQSDEIGPMTNVADLYWRLAATGPIIDQNIANQLGLGNAVPPDYRTIH